MAALGAILLIAAINVSFLAHTSLQAGSHSEEPGENSSLYFNLQIIFLIFGIICYKCTSLRSVGRRSNTILYLGGGGMGGLGFCVKSVTRGGSVMRLCNITLLHLCWVKEYSFI